MCALQNWIVFSELICNTKAKLDRGGFVSHHMHKCLDSIHLILFHFIKCKR